MDQEEIKHQVICHIIPEVMLENSRANLDDDFRLVELEAADTAIDEETNLAEILNSFSFIKLVVKIETAFDIEFDDDKLDLELFSRLGNLLDVIYENKKAKEHMQCLEK